jgi:hypothetical protein
MSVLEEDVVGTHLLHSAIVMKPGSVRRSFLETTCKLLSQLDTCIVGQSDLICGMRKDPGFVFGYLGSRLLVGNVVVVLRVPC